MQIRRDIAYARRSLHLHVQGASGKKGVEKSNARPGTTTWGNDPTGCGGWATERNAFKSSFLSRSESEAAGRPLPAHESRVSYPVIARELWNTRRTCATSRVYTRCPGDTGGSMPRPIRSRCSADIRAAEILNNVHQPSNRCFRPRISTVESVAVLRDKIARYSAHHPVSLRP